MQTSVFPCYMVAIIVFVAMFLLAVIVSQMISFKPDRSDVAARKVWFWVFGALTLVASFGIDFLVNVNSITVPTLYSKFLIHSCIAAFSAFALYILLGIVISNSTRGKLASWF